MIVVHVFDCNYDTIENITVEDKQRLKEKFIQIYLLWEENHAQNAIKARIFDMFQDLSDGRYGVVVDDVAARASKIINESFEDADSLLTAHSTQPFDIIL